MIFQKLYKITKFWGHILEQLKELKVVFNDYNTESFTLANAKISNVNLYKKTNKLELFLQSQDLIPIGEIEKFETYAKKRFSINEVCLKINPEKNVESKNIENDWKDILSYESKKVPVIKAFLKNSTIDVKDNTINTHLKLKGKQILESQGIFADNILKKIEEVIGKSNIILSNGRRE